MSLDLVLQQACDTTSLPESKLIQQWCEHTLKCAPLAKTIAQPTSLTLLIADKAEMSQLNATYRGKDKPTNVLSFPFEPFPQIMGEASIQEPSLGDIVICEAVICSEAAEQQKPLQAHWAHIIIHGLLHLIGYDHIEDEEAQIMETLETKLLHDFGFNDPYHPLQPPSDKIAETS